MKVRFTCGVFFLAAVLLAAGTVRATPPGEGQPAASEPSGAAQPAGGVEPGGPAGGGPAGAEPKIVQDQMNITFNPKGPEPEKPGFWKRLWFGVKTALGFGIPETAEAVREARKFVEKEIPYRQALRDYLRKGGDTKAGLDRLLEEQARRSTR